MGRQVPEAVMDRTEPGSEEAPAKHAPTIAVVVNVFNQARFLADALNSVVGQSLRPNEIIVVDDGSADDPASIAARYEGVRFLAQPNAGLSASRNRGLRETTARYIV